jgi:trk system potassium uptake protein TrkA
VVAIARGITTILPGGDHEILPQDQVLIMASKKDLPKADGPDRGQAAAPAPGDDPGRRSGGSRVAELLGKRVQVKLIEKDESRAAELSHRLACRGASRGRSDAEALDLAGLMDMDTFITATGENETNIMSCMLAKHLMTTSNGAHTARSTKPFPW